MIFFKKNKLFLLPLALGFVIILPLVSCSHLEKSKKESDDSKPEVVNELERIKDSGVLKAVVDYNSTNYFVYRGRPMGFKFELLQQLAKDLGVKLEIHVSNNMAETFSGLNDNRFDLIAKNLTVTRERTSLVDFTIPIDHTEQVLVQRKPVTKEDSAAFVQSAIDIEGKVIYVQKNTSYYRRMVNLAEETGNQFEIVEDTVYGVEQLVANVAKGEIDYTVCDDNIALLNKTYYPNIDVSVKVSFPQKIAWAVRKNSRDWLVYLNSWIREFKGTKKYAYLYYKYFESPRTVARLESDFHSITGGQISQYDNMVMEYSSHHNWDWRLISSIIYQESRFNPQAGSWAGAYGLMQLMPKTAEALGVENIDDPEENIKGGILLLNWINQQYAETVTDSTQRIKFVLASYNIGMGHVQDAQRLAEKFGKDKNTWDDNVDFYLRYKSKAQYYKDPVVKFGYCQGEQAYQYVHKVLNNYKHYLNVIP